MPAFHDILKKYWGYEAFRPLQHDIIKSIVEQKKDALGLLPTGGGKSIIFQVPGIYLEGICLVISPLIALMKDQVENLKKRNIPAAAIYTGMSRHEVYFALDQAIEGTIKFLYVSPERLSTTMFLERLKYIKINLIAVDEAHCISQWGYDFRPSYLKIADIREHLPDVNILALTASATPKVVDDIQEKLKFKEKNVFRKSFERKNLIYIVKRVNNKLGHLLSLVQAIKGTGVVYVRSRKMTEKIAQFLVQNFIAADFYHAGLSPKEKDRKQEAWKNDIIRIIVATNAFGMGIDKPDVRFVIHIDLPDSLEAYYQEAGRGGRDELDAYAFLLYNDEDVENLRRNAQNSFPPKEKIFAVYQALCNNYQIPVGAGKGQTFELIITNFAQTYNFSAIEVYSSLKFLQKEGYLEYTEDINLKSELHILVHRNDLYKFQVENPVFDNFIKFLLRNYAGLFSEYQTIDEYYIANALKSEPANIFKALKKLNDLQIVDYVQAKTTPFFTLTEDRIHPKEFSISQQNYDFLKTNTLEKVEETIKYAQTQQKCRSIILMEYFGQQNATECGRCDVCYDKSQKIKQIKEIASKILSTIHQQNQTAQDLAKKLNYQLDDIIEAIEYLIESKMLEYTNSRKLKIPEK